MITYITIELFLIPFRLIKLFGLLSIEVTKLMLKLPFSLFGGVRKWTKKWLNLG